MHADDAAGAVDVVAEMHSRSGLIEVKASSYSDRRRPSTTSAEHVKPLRPATRSPPTTSSPAACCTMIDVSSIQGTMPAWYLDHFGQQGTTDAHHDRHPRIHPSRTAVLPPHRVGPSTIAVIAELSDGGGRAKLGPAPQSGYRRGAAGGHGECSSVGRHQVWVSQGSESPATHPWGGRVFMALGPLLSEGGLASATFVSDLVPWRIRPLTPRPPSAPTPVKLPSV